MFQKNCIIIAAINTFDPPIIIQFPLQKGDGWLYGKKNCIIIAFIAQAAYPDAHAPLLAQPAEKEDKKNYEEKRAGPSALQGWGEAPYFPGRGSFLNGIAF